jgi:hypothetical protein
MANSKMLKEISHSCRGTGAQSTCTRLSQLKQSAAPIFRRTLLSHERALGTARQHERHYAESIASAPGSIERFSGLTAANEPRGLRIHQARRLHSPVRPHR